MATTTEPEIESAGESVSERGPLPVPHAPAVDMPADSIGYRTKTKLLGPPLRTEQLEHETLGKPTALAVFASDNLSSSAYATEEILRVLIPFIGIAAFSMVVPITGALLVVLFFLILSYRETIKAYPTAGGAYMVTRDNFGLLPAQVAGVALLTDYVLTVAVSVAAGTAALASAFSGLAPYAVPISVAFITLIAFGNLRGVKESGRLFATPTYFFIANMVILLGYGLTKMFTTGLPEADLHQPGTLPMGHPIDGALFFGASVYIVMKAFASGGASVTGVEAISNGVPAFRKPAWKNARETLVLMGSLLGVMFLGLSILAAHIHTPVFDKGTPTVISQVGDIVYGTSAAGRLLFYALQAGTMLILVLAANTSFADFPRLASFHAGDNFMPRQLTKRGHRLVFSNGIIFLAGSAIVLVIATKAEVSRLIPLYAIGVFTSFTLSQAGMAKHHWREREPHWRRGIFINGFGAFLSFVILIVVAITKWNGGAWVIVIFVPIMVVFLVRLARQYETEDRELEEDVPAAVSAPVGSKLVVLVLIDRLDLAAARAVQFGRALRPDDLRAVHFVIDQHKADELAEMWRQHGLAEIALELVDCPDRRLTRSAMTTVAHVLDDGGTEVCVLLPERLGGGFWRRLLHDQTAQALARDISRLPHATVTTVPFLHGRLNGTEPPVLAPMAVDAPSGNGSNGSVPARHRTASMFAADVPTDVSLDGVQPIASVRWREHARVTGRVQSVRVSPLAGTPTLEISLVDSTGSLSVVFLGRRGVRGLEIGAFVTVEGRAVEHRGRLAILNPVYELV